MIELRQYQQDCIAAREVRYRYTGHIEAAEQKGIQRQLVSLPTGTGKTILFCTTAKRRNGRTLILAHRDELIQQAVDKLEMVWDNVSAGVVKAERNETDKQVVVGSVQTVSCENRLEQLPTDFDFIITDECHHGAAATYKRIYEYLGIMPSDEGTDTDETGTSETGISDIRSGTLHLGVTATPERTDKIGLDDVFDEIVFHRNIQDFIPNYLCDLRCVQVMTYVKAKKMASTVAIVCECGQIFHIYLSKQKLFGEIMGDDNEDWEAVDAEEEAAGEIELAKQLAAQADGVFIDSRDTEVATCPRCGEEASLAGFFSQLREMMQTSQDTTQKSS